MFNIIIKLSFHAIVEAAKTNIYLNPHSYEEVPLNGKKAYLPAGFELVVNGS